MHDATFMAFNIRRSFTRSARISFIKQNGMCTVKRKIEVKLTMHIMYLIRDDAFD